MSPIQIVSFFLFSSRCHLPYVCNSLELEPAFCMVFASFGIVCLPFCMPFCHILAPQPLIFFPDTFCGWRVPIIFAIGESYVQPRRSQREATVRGAFLPPDVSQGRNSSAFKASMVAFLLNLTRADSFGLCQAQSSLVAPSAGHVTLLERSVF